MSALTEIKILRTALAEAREESRKLREALTRIAEDDMTRAEPDPHFILRDDGAVYPDDAPQFTYTRDTPRSLARAALRAEPEEPKTYIDEAADVTPEQWDRLLNG